MSLTLTQSEPTAAAESEEAVTEAFLGAASRASHAGGRRPLGEVLVDAGVISRQDVEGALAAQRESGHQKLLGEVLIEQGLCTEEQLLEALAAAHEVPFARITPRLVDPKVVVRLPRDFIERHLTLPLFCVENVLTVAVPEPANVFLQEECERKTGLNVQFVAATAANIMATLKGFLPTENRFVLDEIIEDVAPDDFTLVEQKAVEDIADLEQQAGDSPIIKLVNYLIFSAVKERASDVHVEPGDKSLRVRFRIDGHLAERLRPPHRFAAAVVSRIKIMAGMDIAERRLPQDGAIHVMMDKSPVDLRVSTMPGKHGEKVVIRVINNDVTRLNLETLGFSADVLKRWRQVIQRPNGVVLVTGPTGSGKSTTLYAGLVETSTPEVNICTIEDPIENQLDGINQFQVNEQAGFTFAAALRSLLRQDPDVLMVGEIRDAETAKLASQAALTGHLVFSTLHTNDAAGAAVRLYNLGVDPYLVGSTVAGILAQRLVRRLCLSCREEQPVTAKVRRAVGPDADGREMETMYKPGGCARCRNTGYAGRIGIHELFIPDDASIAAIAGGASAGDLRDLAYKGGMRSLRDDGLEKVRQGVTTLEEVNRCAA